MRTAHVHVAKLTPDQEELAAADGPWARACRDVWNVGLDERLGALEKARGRKMPKGWWPTYASQCRGLSAAKPDAPWLKVAPHHVMQQTLKDLDDAWGRWQFEKIAGKPRWRAKRRSARNWWTPSYRFPDPNQFSIRRLTRRWGEVKLPKIGKVRFRWDRSIPDGAKVTNVTLKQDRTGDWTVVFAIDLGDVEPAPHTRPGTAVGVDRGVAVAAATSDRQMLDPGPTLTAGETERLRRLEKKKARQKPGSANREKTRRQIADLKRRQARRRKDFAHKTAQQLAETYETIAIEELAVSNMVRSAAGTVEEPGTNVAAKRGLNRAIHNKSWGLLKTCLQYKTYRAGGRLLEVDPRNTSRTCAACGHVASESRENQADFTCVACSHHDNADINAARNILARALTEPGAGRALAACGDLQTSVGSTKQEPSTAMALSA